MPAWRQLSAPSYRVPVLAGLVAVVAASALVVVLARRTAQEQEQRMLLMARHVSERTAAAVAGRLRERFGAALFDSIEAIEHTELKAYNLPRIDRFLASGARRHPHITRFFFWHERLPPGWSKEVLFYRPPGESGQRDLPVPGGPPTGAFFRDPRAGPAIWRASHALVQRRRSFAIDEQVLAGARHQLVFHLLWEGAGRERIFGLIGYLVDLDAVRGRHMASMIDEVRPLLESDAGVIEVTLRVTDRDGRLVYGPPGPPNQPSGTAPVELLFFPREHLGQYVAEDGPAESWRLTVAPSVPVTSDDGSSMVLVAATVFFLVVAVLCAAAVNRQAIQLSRLQSEFVANVSHELRTPLALLSGAAETLGLERVRSPDKVKEYARIVETHARRLSGLVERILLFHRAEAGSDPDDFERVDLGELVLRAVEHFRLTPPDERSARIHVERAMPAPAVRGDAAALECAVVNLVDNALKYGRSGDGDVVVSVAIDDGQGVITVRDHGVGIGADDLPHIFEKFYRGGGHRSPRPGFGLGLAITRSIVDAHGGRIAVESEPGRGSAFSVRLPLVG